MKKQNFDEAGLMALQQMLYALTNQELNKQVVDLSLNFQGWVNENFNLDERQQRFFDDLNGDVLQFITEQCAFAAINRLPVTLIKTGALTQKANGADGDKLFRPKSSLYATTNANGGYEAGGSLQFEVIYLN